MANIKNFGLIGVANDVQFGKTGPRLKAESGIFAFRGADGTALTDVKAANVVADSLKSGAGKIVTVDSSGQLVVDATIASLATDAELAAAIAQEVTDRNAAIAAATGTIQTEVDAIETSVGLNTDGTITLGSNNYFGAATTLLAAVKGVDAQLKTTTDGLAAEIFRATAAEATKLSLSGGTMTGALILAANPTTALEAATKNYVDSLAGGLSWQQPVVAVVADTTARDALTGLVVGDRVIVLSDDKIYTVTVADPLTFNAGELPGDGYAAFDKSTETGYVYNGTDWVQFTGTGQITAGLGLSKSGNRLDVEVSASGGLHFTPDEVSETSVLALKLDGSSLSLSSSGVKVSDTLTTEITALRTDLTAETAARTAADSALQSELDATQAGAGLTTAGAYTASTTANYLNAADFTGASLTANLFNADMLLDAKIKQVADAVAATVVNFTLSDGTNTDVFNTGETLTFQGSADVVTAVTDNQVAFSLSNSGSAGTYTKITVDAKGRATAGAQATTTDIAEGSNLYFTDARARGAISIDTTAGHTGLEYNSTTGVLGIDQTVIATKAYVDSVVTAGVTNVAKGITVPFSGTDTTIGVVAGFVHRVKVYVNVASTSDNVIQVGTATTNNELVSTADVDSSTTGVYVIEVGVNYASNTTLHIFSDATATGRVVVEYI